MKELSTAKISLVWSGQDLIQDELPIEDLLSFIGSNQQEWYSLSGSEKQELLKEAAFEYLMNDLQMSLEAFVEIQ
ncbi:MAG: hypothetical protein F6K14_11645 [Symploca sp. SIO2C1]|nr:hypothetical protein [Symploca sp. SIO2C1]